MPMADLSSYPVATSLTILSQAFNVMVIVYFTPSACRCMEIFAIVVSTEGVFANLFPKTGPSGKKRFYSVMV